MQRRWFLACCLLAACGGDDGSGPGGGDGCAFATELTGAISATFTASDPMTCAAANSSGGDPIIVFYPTHATVMRFDLEFDSSVAGMTGPGVAGTVKVINKSGTVWETDCTFDLVRWEGTGGMQRLEGSTSCPDPAPPDVGAGTITIGPIAFDM